MKRNTTEQRFVVCIRNEGCEDLAIRKLYRVLSDSRSSKAGYLRVIDEAGEDYLYPENLFVPIVLPQEIEAALALT